MRFVIIFLILVLVSSCNKNEAQTAELVPYLHWESNSVNANGIRLHYWRTGGESKPVMILAHGITDYGLNWADLASWFEDEYDIIMYDARGHGFSEKTAPYTLDAHMRDLVGLIEVLNIDKPILMGHSMGGSTVALTAATFPDIPAAIILEDPPMEEALEQLTPEILPDWKAWVATQTQTPKSKLMYNARTEYHPGWTEFQYDHWAESKRLVVPEVIDILNGAGFGNPRDIFPNITVPTLILKADAEEEFRQRHLEAASLLPNGRLVHINGANHVIRNDKPEEVKKEVRNFLSRLEQRTKN